MPSLPERNLLDHFSQIKDPRIDRKKLYPLTEILLMVFCGVLCGAESWRDLVIFGNAKIDFLRKVLPFENGVPSKNTFQRVMCAIGPDQFKQCITSWVDGFKELLGKGIHIDGKTVRRSFDKTKGLAPLHLVHAFAGEHGLLLGEEKVSDHSNEITAIPKLLELLSLKGAVVTIDAMGTQKEIARQIVDQKGDYVLALKENHPELSGEVKQLFSDDVLRKEMNTHEQTDSGHGRVEVRTCYATENLDWCEAKKEWEGLKSVAMIESTRTHQDKETTERRFYLSSLEADAEALNRHIRSHWCVENSLHWVLDMTFREDESRIRDRNAAENMAIVRRFTLNLIRHAKQHHKKEISLKAMRKKAGWNDQTLEDIILGKF